MAGIIPAQPAKIPTTTNLPQTSQDWSSLLNPSDPKALLAQKLSMTPDLVARKTELENQAGVSDLTKTAQGYAAEVNSTMDLLNNLESNITARINTGGYMVSEPQRARILASEKTPLSNFLRTEQAGEKTATANLTTAEKSVTDQLNLEEKQRTNETSDLQKLITAGKVPTKTVNIGGRELMINSDTGETIKDLGPAGKTGTGGAGNTLTLSEATTNGLPLEMVGMAESDVAKDLSSNTPPSWFKTKIESENKQSMAPDALTKLWTTFKGQFVSSKGTLTKPKTTSTSSSSVPAGASLFGGS